jgi:hypothetical protein
LSLREAIEEANATGAGMIVFAVNGTIDVGSTGKGGLPAITVPLTLDGAGAIELNGSAAPGWARLELDSPNSSIRGLTINRFGTGIEMTADCNGDVIQGCFIGTDPSGTIARPNMGVFVDTGGGNALRQNAIFASGYLGIELANRGNNSQPAPVLTSAASDGSSTTIEGTLTAAPGTLFTLEFFGNTVCNPTGFGEGETFLGTQTVTTDASGTSQFTVTLNVGLDMGQFVAATATDPNANTSQFSRCVPVDGPHIPWPGVRGGPAFQEAGSLFPDASRLEALLGTGVAVPSGRGLDRLSDGPGWQQTPGVGRASEDNSFVPRATGAGFTDAPGITAFANSGDSAGRGTDAEPGFVRATAWEPE